jgi:hypothetical protein
MGVPARAVSGLTPAARALFVAGAAHALSHGVVLYVVPADATSSRPSRMSASL